MNKDKKIERQENEIQRQRDKIAELQDENSALKKALSDKDSCMSAIEAEREELYARWEKQLREHAQAIEEAYEAKMKYEESYRQIVEIKEKYEKDMSALLRSFRRAQPKYKS